MAFWGLPAASHHQHFHRGDPKQCGQQWQQEKKATTRAAAATAIAIADECKRTQCQQSAVAARDQTKTNVCLRAACVGALFVLVLILVLIFLCFFRNHTPVITITAVRVKRGIAGGRRAGTARRVGMLWEWLRRLRVD